MTHLTRLRAAAALSTLTLGLGSLAAPAVAADPSPAIATTGAAAPGPTTYAGSGPFAVGQRTMRLPSGAPVEVWYPTRAKDVVGQREGSYDVFEWLPPFLRGLAPKGASVTYPSGGVRRARILHRKLPVVLFSHGFAGFREQSTFLTSALASWGFLVASPDHRSRTMTTVLGGPAGPTTDVADLRATITLLGTKNRTKKGWLRKRVDLSRIGAVGHSAGGRAVENLATVDRRVDTFVGLAGASVGALDGEATAVPRQPGLLVAGSADTIVTQERMEQAYAAMAAPKRFVLLEGAGHLAFSDLCEVGEADGGLLAVAAVLGVPIPERLVPLASDGCVDPVLESTAAWPVIRHLVVAHLRQALGTDRDGAALDGLVEAYPGVVSQSLSTP